MIERGGNVLTKVGDDTTRATVQGIIATQVEAGSTVMTDEYNSYRGLSTVYFHEIVQHSAKQFVNGMVHTKRYCHFAIRIAIKDKGY